MIRQPFSTGWTFRPKVNEFAEAAQSVPEKPVTLPHDAVIGTPRDPDGDAPSAFFPGGTWEYTKSFSVPEEYATKRIRIEFEGVHRQRTNPDKQPDT